MLSRNRVGLTPGKPESMREAFGHCARAEWQLWPSSSSAKLDSLNGIQLDAAITWNLRLQTARRALGRDERMLSAAAKRVYLSIRIVSAAFLGGAPGWRLSPPSPAPLSLQQLTTAATHS